MAMPRIGMRQITMGRKLAYATVDSRTASVTAMLCVGPELAMEMTTMSPARRAASFSVLPAWSGVCSPAGAALLLLVDDDMACLHIGVSVLVAPRTADIGWRGAALRAVLPGMPQTLEEQPAVTQQASRDTGSHNRLLIHHVALLTDLRRAITAKASCAALSMSSTSAAVCTRDRNRFSYWLGWNSTPRSSISCHHWVNRSSSA